MTSFTGYIPGMSVPKYGPGHNETNSCPNNAAPNELPESPGLGIIHIDSQISNSLVFATQFNATPPMYTISFIPVLSIAYSQYFTINSSATACILAAKSSVFASGK